MDLEIKTPHNYPSYLVKHNKNTDFHPIIGIINSSKYLYILIADAPIYLCTLREFWENAKLSLQNKKPFLITSAVNEHVEITKQSIYTVFRLEDMLGMETYPQNEFQAEFIERDYEGQMVGATLFKPKFPPEMNFFFLLKPLLLMKYPRKLSI
ncbi:hypothetical protein Hanom_Chr17g01576121 [Helianthus anomalus]